jgi:hypothetical protein
VVAYEFYWGDLTKGYQLIGTLPERRKNPLRITQASIMNWGGNVFNEKMDTKNIFFIQVTIDENTGRIDRPNHEMIAYKVFYKNYELKRGELMGILIERRKDLRGMMQIESGLKWARSTFGGYVRNKQLIFVVPRELKSTNLVKSEMSF